MAFLAASDSGIAIEFSSCETLARPFPRRSAYSMQQGAAAKLRHRLILAGRFSVPCLRSVFSAGELRAQLTADHDLFDEELYAPGLDNVIHEMLSKLGQDTERDG